VGDTLKVAKRTETGTARMRRLRDQGKIPAVLYGHGMESVNLTLEWRDLDSVLSHHGHFVQLTGDVSDSALIKDVQWDHVAQSCLHVDLTRVSATEKVEVSVELVLKGVAKGVADGGVVLHLVHSLDIECPANVIPERLELNITGLELNDSMRAGEVVLPPGAELVTSEDTTIVSCSLPVVEEEEESTAESVEPEVIEKGGKAEEDGESED
jgi:large subunit ribosomal protein L25